MHPESQTEPRASSGDDARLAALRRWLDAELPPGKRILTPASTDASFRRYFRVEFADGAHGSLIAMDAPPDKEDCTAFLRAAALFQAAGAHVPAVHARNLADGFLLLEDLGTQTYLDALTCAHPAPDRVAGDLYAAAIDALIAIQLSSRPDRLPPYDAALLRRELALFPDWYVAKHLASRLSAPDAGALDSAFDAIVANNLAQPRVYVHRDYHSRNLMVCEPLPGVIDFQDAVHGPVTYDLVSLLKDAYIRWEDERIVEWCARYWERARKAGLPVHGEFADFFRDFEWMGVQRHLKVAGIFARLCHRDGKARYLADLPLVLGYLQKACERYRELGPLAGLMERLHSGGFAQASTPQ